MDDETIQQIRKLRREKLQWTVEEMSFRNKQNFRDKNCGRCDFDFSTSIDKVFRETVFGVHLKSLNVNEKHNSFLNENKLGITQWDFMRYSDDKLDKFIEKNLVTDDLYDLLLKAIKTLEVIDWDYLHNSLFCLRLSRCNVSYIIY